MLKRTVVGRWSDEQPWERKPAGMHCTTYDHIPKVHEYNRGCFGRSKRNHREVTYSIVQDVGRVSVAVLDDEGGESKNQSGSMQRSSV